MKERVHDLLGLQKKLEDQLDVFDCSPQTVQLYIRAFKAEQQLELWIKAGEEVKWKKFRLFPFCKMSGQLGPKRKEGDRQIPEGIYHIDRFNPKSKYHLSLGLNYPNKSDIILGDPKRPGSDIFIHGGCESVGCIAITDCRVEEVYLLASWASENGQQKIPVHLYPFHFNAANWRKYGPDWAQLHSFWMELEAIYQVFEESKVLPEFAISDDGHYRLL